MKRSRFTAAVHSAFMVLLLAMQATPVAGSCDGDGDGICDVEDNCPQAHNPGQQDLDADGLGDICDPDDDGDGVADADDLCPTVADPGQIDGDADGVGNACDVIVEDLTDAVFLVYGPASPSAVGYSLTAGDLNQDGTADLLIGAPALLSPYHGAIYGFHGPLAGHIDLATETAGLTLWSSSGINLGASCAIGDLTLDGVNDVVGADTGAWGYCSCETCFGGQLTLISGTLLTPGVTLDISTQAEQEISTCEERIGWRTVLADLDGDDKLDLISTGSFSNPEFQDGYAYVYLNDPLDQPPFGPDVQMYGRLDERAGAGLASGDIDGDGIDDLVIGAPGAPGPDELQPDTGAIYVVRGTQAGFPALLEFAAGAAAWLHGDAAGDRVGESIAVSDWNGDGFDDILVGAPGADGPTGSPRSDAGAAYLVLGRADLAPLLGARLGDVARLRADGPLAGARLGWTLGIGDLDDDAIGDLVLGAPDTHGPLGLRPQAGSFRVLPGSRVPQAARIDLASVPASRIIHGSAAGDGLAWNAQPVIARLSGSSTPDLVIGAAWADGPGGTRVYAGEAGVLAPPDVDGDGRIDSLDCRPDDPTSIGLGPTGNASYFEPDGQMFVWSAVAGATSYALLRGTMGARWRDDAAPLVGGLPSPQGADASVPAPGTGYWYDSTAESVDCIGPPGSGTGGVARSVVAVGAMTLAARGPRPAISLNGTPGISGPGLTRRSAAGLEPVRFAPGATNPPGPSAETNNATLCPGFRYPRP